MAVTNVVPIRGKYSVAGAGGFAFVTGTIALDGSGATTVDLASQGLTSVTGALVCLNTASALGDLAEDVTVSWATTVVSFWPNKNTSGTDPTLVASDSTLTVSYLAWGPT